MKNKIQPNHRERVMRADDFIVSKTDTKGRITYGNSIFIEFSGYSEKELLNVQHNIIRHPDMPRGVFKFLWDTISAGNECNAYVKNLAKDGSFYWVFANVTPSYDTAGNIIGYYSVRRKPRIEGIKTVEPIYKEMLEAEQAAGAKNAMDASLSLLVTKLKNAGVSYEQFVLSI